MHPKYLWLLWFSGWNLIWAHTTQLAVMSICLALACNHGSTVLSFVWLWCLGSTQTIYLTMPAASLCLNTHSLFWQEHHRTDDAFVSEVWEKVMSSHSIIGDIYFGHWLKWHLSSISLTCPFSLCHSWESQVEVVAVTMFNSSSNFFNKIAEFIYNYLHLSQGDFSLIRSEMYIYLWDHCRKSNQILIKMQRTNHHMVPSSNWYVYNAVSELKA